MATEIVLQQGIEKGITKLTHQVRKAMSRALFLSVNQMRNEAIRLMKETPRTRPPKGPRGHIPSSPGNAPAIDTGALVRSLRISTDYIRLEGKMFTNIKYAKWLEYGTLDGKLKPRPFLRPAVENSRKLIDGYFAEAAKEVKQ